MGDLNLDRLKPNEREGKMLTDLEQVFDLTCLIDRATRVTTTSWTLLDVILTNAPDLLMSSGVAELGLSDHKAIYSLLNKEVKQHTARVVECRSTKKLNLEEFRKDLHNTELTEDSTQSVNKFYTDWRKKFINIVDMRVRQYDVPYMNAECKAAIRKKKEVREEVQQG